MSSFETSTTSATTKNVSFTASTKLNKPATSKRIKPLSRDFFTQLIKLENDFHKKLYTVATLDELIQFYAKAVEYYDSIKDEISAYFMFKIQDILATKTSLKMLFDQKNKSGRKNDAEAEHVSSNVESSAFDAAIPEQDEDGEGKANVKETYSEDEDDYDENQMTEAERKRRAKKKQPWNGRVSITMMKYEKQRFVNFFYKMETQKNSAKQTMNAVMDEFEKTSDKNDGFVKTDIDAQREKLRQRLEKRNAETLKTHTMSIQPRISRKEVELVEEDIIIEKKRNDMIFESFLENAEPIKEELLKDMQVADSDSSDGEEEEDDRGRKSAELDAPMHTQSNMRQVVSKKSKTRSPELGNNQGEGGDEDDDEPEIL